MKNLKTILLLTTAITSSTLFCTTANAGFFEKSVSKEELNETIHNYILEHPEVIMESIKKAQQKMMEQEQEKMKAAVKESQSNLENDALSPISGNKDGKFVVVQFFDYRCGHCKHSGPDLAKFISDNPDVKVIYRNLGILGPDSNLAAQASIAVYKLYPASFAEFHRDLLATPDVNQAAIDALFAKYKMDKAAVEKEMKAETTAKALEDNKQLAMKIGIRGVPAYIINGELVPGGVNYEVLKAKYDQLNQKPTDQEAKKE